MAGKRQVGFPLILAGAWAAGVTYEGMQADDPRGLAVLTRGEVNQAKSRQLLKDLP